MQYRTPMRANAYALACSLLVSFSFVASSAVAAEQCADLKYVDAKGNIQLPENFRQDYTHLGSWYVPEGDASGFHDVYLDPISVEIYRETKEFPDGAVLVKELRGAKIADYTTGANVAHAVDAIKQVFVMVKDTCGRFADNPVWGDGWGWGLFKPGSGPKQNVAKSYQSECQGCHAPARATDWVYIEAYPTLH